MASRRVPSDCCGFLSNTYTEANCSSRWVRKHHRWAFVAQDGYPISTPTNQYLLQRFVDWLHSISQAAWKAACKAALKDSVFFPSLLWLLAAFFLELTKCLLFLHINWSWRMSANRSRAIRQVSSQQTPCKGFFQCLILQPQKHLLQSLYWRLHSKLPWSRTVTFSFVFIVAILVCRFLSSAVKVFSASPESIEVEECQSRSGHWSRVSEINCIHTCVSKPLAAAPEAHGLADCCAMFSLWRKKGRVSAWPYLVLQRFWPDLCLNF